MKFLGDIDLEHGELKNAAIHNAASAPSNSVEGQLWFDTANHVLKVWDGTSWVSCGGSSAPSDWESLGAAMAKVSEPGATGKVFEVEIDGDFSTILAPGMRIKATESGQTKFFIILSNNGYATGHTTLYLFGGCDFGVSAELSDVFYSACKAPTGFPLDPDAWALVWDGSPYVEIGSPDSRTFYDIGNGSTLVVPAGYWKMSWKATVGVDKSEGPATVLCGIGGDPTEPPTDFRFFLDAWDGQGSVRQTFFFEYPLLLSAEMEFFLMAAASNGGDSLIHFGDLLSMFVRADCAYL